LQWSNTGWNEGVGGQVLQDMISQNVQVFYARRCPGTGRRDGEKAELTAVMTSPRM
jgi:hypothetical protein